MTTEATPVDQQTPETPPITPASTQPMPFNTADLLGAEAAQPPSAANMPGVTDTNVREFGFDDEDIKQYEFDLYKGRKGVTDRLCLLALPLGARVHFQQGIGYFQCLSTYQKQMVGGSKIEVCTHRAACCVHGNAPRKRFVTPLIQYNTQPNGQLLPQFGYALKGWVYSDDKFIMMRTIHGEHPLLDHDLLITCTEEGYQKLTIAACREALWKKPQIPQQMKDEVKTWVDNMRPKMGKMLGKKKTEQEFLQAAGLVKPPALAPGADAPMVDLAGLLDG